MNPALISILLFPMLIAVATGALGIVESSLIVVFYFAGQCLHFLVKAYAVIKSDSPINSARAYWNAYWIVLVARLFAQTLLFVIAAVLRSYFFPNLKIDLSGIDPILAVALKCSVAGLVGLACDSLLDKVQVWLKDKFSIDLSQFIPDAPTGKTMIGSRDDQASGRGAGGV